MFKLVVLSALMAIVAAKPSGIALGYSAIAAPLALPAAVSHQYRTDVISKPVVAAYAAPIIQKAVVAAPAIVAAAPLAYSAAVTHQSRYDLHHTLAAPLAYAAPVAYASHAPVLRSW